MIFHQMNRQAGAELCQTQVQPEVVVEIGVELGVEVESCHYQPGWVVGGWTKTKLMLFSTQVEVEVEAEVEAEAELDETYLHYQPRWVGGWTKTKLMLFSTQAEVVVDLKLELSLAKTYITPPYRDNFNPKYVEIPNHWFYIF